MPLKRLRLTNLGPFDEVEFDLDEHVNVFTGPNNSGKSTALIALGEITVYPFLMPSKLLRAATSAFRVEHNGHGEVWESRFPIDGRDKQQIDDSVRFMTAVGYSSFVPAIRHSTDFRAEAPTVSRRSDEMGAESSPETQELHKRYEELDKRERLIETDALSVSDEAVVQRIIDLDYRAYRRDKPAIRNIVDRTAAIASEVTEGYPIRFVRVDEDDDGLFPKFNTPDGELPLNVLSQGTQSLIQWLARLLIGMAEYYDYPEDLEATRGVLIIDEIDAHLHPSWQRRIIPTLTSHFPNLQIFCSTHSPLMLAGLEAGQVQLLERADDGKVTVSRNEQDVVGWSADEILQSFLDVRNPTDLETSGKIERLQQLRRMYRPTEEQAKELERLRKTVRSDLIGGPLARDLEELRAVLSEAKSKYDPAPSSE